MAKNEKKSKSSTTVKRDQDNRCPVKEGDNCKVPGVFSDSDPIGGGG